MRGVIVHNPLAGSRRGVLDQAWWAHHGLSIVRLAPGQSAGDAAREALAGGARLLVAAGGDGTAHDVGEAILGSGIDATLAILPLGTGNDLARALHVPPDQDGARDVVLGGDDRLIDVIRGESPDGDVHALNAASCGLSSEIARRLTRDVKARWGPFAYFIGMLEAIPSIGTDPIRVEWEDGVADVLDAVNVIIANGGSVAGGLVMAPDADLEDGMLDVVIVRRGSRWALARMLAALGAHGQAKSAPLSVHRVRAVTLHSGKGGLFNVDGEPVERPTLRFVAREKALRVRVGPGYGRGRRDHQPS